MGVRSTGVILQQSGRRTSLRIFTNTFGIGGGGTNFVAPVATV